MHHHEGHLGSGPTLVISDIGKIFSAAELIFLVFLAEYFAAEAQGISHLPNL